MQRTNFGDMACSIARTLDVIGEPWSPLVLRDVYAGFTRFEQIQADLGVSRKVLTERLNHLVEQGVLERRPYDRRPRYEYLLTEKGTQLVDLLMVMVGWGDKWLAGQAGPPVLYRHHACGEVSHVDLRCAHCGEPMHAVDVDLLPGPGAAKGNVLRCGRMTSPLESAYAKITSSAAVSRPTSSDMNGLKSRTVQGPSVSGHVALSFDRLRAEALPWRASRDLMRKVAEEKWT
jgi:DNA-binding HxlR family transcriptional regulator